jgi:8-oxo-dGTP diphosphatase
MAYTYNYPRPMVTVDAVVFRKMHDYHEVLLIRRKHYPFEGMWALPGGFIDMEETAEEAIVRELEEETHLRVNDLQQLHTFSTLGRDPRGRTISVTFFGVVNADQSQVSGGDDAEEAKWFPVNDLPALAFDHTEVVKMALDRM